MQTKKSRTNQLDSFESIERAGKSYKSESPALQEGQSDAQAASWPALLAYLALLYDW